MAIPSDESGSTSYSSMLERLKKRPALQQEFKGQLAEKAGVDAADVNDKNLAGVSSALRGAGEVAKSGSDPSKADVSSLQAADPAKAAAPAKTDDPEEKSKQQKLMMALAGVLPTMLGYAFGGYEGGAIGAKAGAAGVEGIGKGIKDENERTDKKAKDAAELQIKRDEVGEKAHGRKIEEKKLEQGERKLQQDATIEREKLASHERIERGKEGKGKPLAAEQTDRLAGHDASLQTIADLRQAVQANPNYFGPVEGRVKSSNPYNTFAQGLQAATKSAAQNIGKSLEGGKLTDNDIARYQKMLPSNEDTPEVATLKLDLLERMVKQRLTADVGSFKKAGLNVGQFDAQQPNDVRILHGEKPKGGGGGIPGVASAVAAPAAPDFDKMSDAELKKFLGRK